MKTKVKFNLPYEIGLLMTCLILATEHFGHSLPEWLDKCLIVFSLVLTLIGLFKLGKDNCRNRNNKDK